LQTFPPPLCLIGFYCPSASTAGTGSGMCDAGYFCPVGSSSAQQIICPGGSFCIQGLTVLPPPLCAPGYYCAPGKSNVLGDGVCSQGAWCPAGSSSRAGAGPCTGIKSVLILSMLGRIEIVHMIMFQCCPAGSFDWRESDP
jgi:hypothetical protein